LGKIFLALDESLCFIVIQYQSYLIHTTRTIQGVNGISLWPRHKSKTSSFRENFKKKLGKNFLALDESLCFIVD